MMMNITVTPMDEADRQNGRFSCETSNLALIWQNYSEDYNSLVKKMEAANIDIELLIRIINEAVALDRINIDVS